jgi:hypothetical protein
MTLSPKTLALSCLFLSLAGCDGNDDSTDIVLADEPPSSARAKKVPTDLPVNGDCSNVNATVRWEAFKKQGGAKPGPGTVLRSKVLKISDNVLFSEIDRVPGGLEPETGDKVDVATVALVKKSVKALEQKSDQLSGSTTYVGQITITFKDGSDTLSEWVICNDSFNLKVP